MKIIEVSKYCKFVEENIFLTKLYIFGINQAVNNQMKYKKENLELQANTHICNRILKNEKKFSSSETKMNVHLTNLILSMLNPCSPDI